MRDKRLAATAGSLLLLGLASPDVHAQALPTSGCRPVTPVALHPAANACVRTDFMGEPFRVNRRLAVIENGRVPCVEVDTMEVTQCVFDTGARRSGGRLAGRASGPWLQDAQRQRYAVVGQPVTRDGVPAHGAFIVGTVADAEGKVPCVGASGHDMASTAEGTDMADMCVLETAGSETNVTRNAQGNPQTLVNWTDQYVGTTSIPHPDEAWLVSVDPDRLIAWYTDTGAALNDTGGIERDREGNEMGGLGRCHYVEISGVQVPGAKRPSTKSHPPPGSVNVNSRIRWLAVNPYVTIANASPYDARGLYPVRARFTFSVGMNTLFVDASASEGEIIRYVWRVVLGNRIIDAATRTPTASFPLTVANELRPRSGTVALTVIGRDGQQGILSLDVSEALRSQGRPFAAGWPSRAHSLSRAAARGRPPSWLSARRFWRRAPKARMGAA